ncbi:uncharacterized protein LOC122290372 isoform X2 [Carya illinoinensis]|uniref:uncharacterized protein LOC122290372 isoform X2 n=1 Tax=Carya illinoinensis TaxID=32201 RepID=UPI001C717FC1|nr:uncharacterized protein LOC122290372 isoform X2 [Carya illinoinensis]
MLEEQVANLLQRYLGNYVKGLNKEALKISVWQGNVELTNMQLKPEALNELKLPVKVKAGFLGSVKLKVPWSRLGQDPVLVYLDRIFLLAEPETQVEGSSEDAVQEAKKRRVQEMELKLLERSQRLKSEMNKSWLGSLVNTIIGNLKLSISNIHIRYEDLESNPGHQFAAGITLEKLSAVTVDDNEEETFVTGGSLDCVQKSVELDQLAVYLDSDIVPWHVEKSWEKLLPSEWLKVFRFGTKDGKPADSLTKKHNYILQPVSGKAKYTKLRQNEFADGSQPQQKAVVNLDDVTLCLSKDGYRHILKLADNFAAFNQRLQYAHYRPNINVKSDPRSWWKYAYKAVSDQMKKASGKLSWEQVLRLASLRKKYISLYASLLKSDPSRTVVDDNKDIEELDRGLDIELILQWRMLAHKFVEQSIGSEDDSKKQKPKKSWWPFGWNNQSLKDEDESFKFSEEDWEQLNKIIGYKEGEEGQSFIINNKKDAVHTFLEFHMKHNASRLLDEAKNYLAELSCEGLDCSIKLYPETKAFDMKLGSYRLSSPNGLLAESATTYDSLVGVFCYKPFDSKVDWSMVAKASPCYMTYLKESIDQIINFFESNTAVSQTIALETATAVQMTIDGVKRTAQQQVNRALKDHARFLLNLDIAAPKITIPTDFRPDKSHATKLLLDLGNLLIRTQDEYEVGSPEELDMYLQFDLVLSDISAFLVDGDYHWSENPSNKYDPSASTSGVGFLPLIDKCGVILRLQQIRLENPSYPSTRLAVRLPSLGFHFSPARYHRLMQVMKIFQGSDGEDLDLLLPWNQADFEGWLPLLTWKGVGNREAVWQRRYICLVGPFLYVLESPFSKSYKQRISLRGKQIYEVPPDFVGGEEHVLALCSAAQPIIKVVEDANALILRCDSDDSRKVWHSRLQGAIYRASGAAPITGLSETSSEPEDSEAELGENRDAIDVLNTERLFVAGVLDELKVSFSYSYQHEHSYMNVLLAEESNLFEFRAIGGQVELSIIENDMFIGTVLKSLEVEDLICCNKVSCPCFLARSFIGSTDANSSFYDVGDQSADNCVTPSGDDTFYETAENLVDSVDNPPWSPKNESECLGSSNLPRSEILSLKPPSFNRISGLLPTDAIGTKRQDIKLSDTLDSFVKAQIIIYDRNSPGYNNIDNQVTVTLATLSFFCRRPTVVAIMEFSNAINIKDESCESFSDSSSAATGKQEVSKDVIDDKYSTTVGDPVIKGLLGKGKSRIMFNLKLHMAHAQIVLMNEDETKLSCLLQDNLLTDIKVFPSSLSIKAALGNLRISDDSLPSSHMYFWVCDMRNPGGSSFVELVFTSYSADDEDYEGYEYSLFGELSEVRIVFLNRFLQEVVSYFMGLVPNNSKAVVKLKDQVTNSEKWFTTSEIEGSPAVKLDLSLRKPIILMPRRTDSLDYLKLDIVHITVKNTFQWYCGHKSEINAVHSEILTIQVEDINLNVGTGAELGESIIQDVKGVSVIIQRSLRDLLHQIPSTEVTVKIEELKAALSSREYQIISECALSNISETPHVVPPLKHDSRTSSVGAIEPIIPQNTAGVESETTNGEAWIMMKVSVVIDLVELRLHPGSTRDAYLATVQISDAWLLYKSSTLGEGFLSATLKGFTVIDDREGTEQEFKLAIGRAENSCLHIGTCDENEHVVVANVFGENDVKPVPPMLILDAKFTKLTTSVSFCVQRPQMLVALDFLLAVVEFFVPSVGNMLSNEEDTKSVVIDAIILDQSIYRQPSAEASLSPERPLIADDERFDLFVYDGNGGVLFLKDRQGFNLSAPSTEPIIYVGNGKKLHFKNVVIKNGLYLDSSVFLGADSSYSASNDDRVYLEGNEAPHSSTSRESDNDVPSQDNIADRSMEFIIELQAIGPELTFYNPSKGVGESFLLSNQLLHAQLDAFCRLVSKADNIEMNANAIGLTMQSNGITILEPFDTSIIYSNASGKTNMHLSVSDILMNFSFSILRLFLAVEEDILAFLRTTSKKMTFVCSQFDKVGTIKNPYTDQIYAFWRPHAPPGFAVLGDCLTPLDKPPTKGVLAVNTNIVRVKRPISFKFIWSPLSSGDISDQGVNNSDLVPNGTSKGDSNFSIWLPEAPKGYVALGCVVSPGRTPPPLSSAFCILASLVCPCSLRDCIAIRTSTSLSSVAFWRVDNSVGTFLPAAPTSYGLTPGAYDLRHMIFGLSEGFANATSSSDAQASPSSHMHSQQSQRSATANSGRRFEAVASFRLIWWNQGSNSRKKLSVWRPVVPPGMIYFGDIAVKGYEPPNTCIVLHDAEDDELFKAPLSFQPVGKIKKQKGMDSISFWLPQPPPGFVSLGCIASKSTPKQNEFSTLRCIRSDMVTGDQFLEESIWDTSDAKFTAESFSIWLVDNELGTFIVRSGFKKPPRRFALRLADSGVPSGSDDTVIDAEIPTFSVALFDDYSGLMVPLFNVSFSGVGFNLHGRTDYLSSTVNFSLVARSYNDKYDSWEPLIEPVDGFLRYLYDFNAPGAASQLRVTSTKDLNLNVSVSNANMIIQAYASWNNLSHVHESQRKREAFSPTHGGRSVFDIHHSRDYYIIPQNKLGQDIFIRATDIRGIPNMIWMPSGDVKPVKVPVSKNMSDSHLKGKVCRKARTMVTVIIVDGQFPRVEALTSHQYSVAIRLSPFQNLSSESQLHQQSARTCGSSSNNFSSSEFEMVNWNEVFFFKVDSPDYYLAELVVTDMAKGDPIGYFSVPLKQIAGNIQGSSDSDNYVTRLTWIDLSSTESVSMIESDKCKGLCGRIRCAILLSPRSDDEDSNQPVVSNRKSGHIQISPSREGPWTTVRLNYAAPAACWRFGNDVVASEVSVKDGDRYVNIRSLVSIRNNTDFILELCLAPKASTENMKPQDKTTNQKGLQIDGKSIQTDEFIETEEYDPIIGWVGRVVLSNQDISEDASSHQAISEVELPSGWEWIDDWHLDKTSSNDADGWVYASDVQSLKWPESFDTQKSVSHARQRRWIKSRKQISCEFNRDISIGQLNPGDTVSVPLSSLSQSGMYVLQVRPFNLTNLDEYTWSSVVDKPGKPEDYGKPKVYSGICVSSLTECEELLYCTQITGTSSSRSHKLWFCLSIQATEIAKDIHSNPIQDWSLVVKSPLSVTNFLPLAAEYSVLEMQPSGHFVACSRGVFGLGETVKIYSADIRNPLFFSLLPQRGWLPIHEAVPMSDPNGVPAKTISLRSSISGRIVQIILEQNDNKEQSLLAKIIRVYAPYWFEVTRCPPLTFRLVDLPGKKHTWKIALPIQSKDKKEVLYEEITEDELFGGHTIASAMNFNTLGLSVSIAQSGDERFGPVKDLSPLGDMDGSLDLYAYDADGNCIRLLITTKPCLYQSVPTKVISVRPFMTFTNRLGQDIFIKFCTEDEPKRLHASDSRIFFVHSETSSSDNLLVRLEDTNWSFPIKVIKEDTISLVLRRHNGTRRFLRTEIRGYEEGSRFVVVFRLGSTNGPIRIENRALHKTISIRQSGISEDAWIQLQPLSTTSFCWEDPYGERFIDAKVVGNDINCVWKLDLERIGLVSAEEQELQLKFLVFEMGNVKVARFMEDGTLTGIWGNYHIQSKMQNDAAPVELMIELRVFGVSVVDHIPKELSYLYLERVLISYSAGYDGGKTSRFKLILGHLQLDNQLPLTPMPVLLAPEQTSDVNHPVFKMTVTKRNENTDGIQVYPYVYIRVTEKCWRLNIHEPIIWAVVDFYNNLQLDRIPQSSSVTEVDPEIRFDLIDVSELRLKVSLETAPAQRPHGVLGVWSPILSAIGNAFKIQVHLRRVMHSDRFMRKSSIIPAIGNRIWRDLIHNPLHLIFSVDVLGMTSSTLASLGKGLAELSTDGQFLQLRSKQVSSRRITGVGDGIIQGTEALAQGFAFGVSGVVTKPVESARQNGLLGLAHGLGRAFLGFVVQPVSGALDFFSLTVDGIGASWTKCLEAFTSTTTFQRIRNPRAIHSDGVLREYCEREASGQMILYLSEASRHFGCTEIFKEPSKFALSDYYEQQFYVPYNRIVLVTNRRVMLLQRLAQDKLDKKPCKIIWDVPWEELMAVELAKAGSNQPSHVILHLKNFRKSENFVRVIKCRVEESEGREPQAVRICVVVHKMWKASDRKGVKLKVPSRERYVFFAWSEADGRELPSSNKAIVKLRRLSSDGSPSDERRFVKHVVNFVKIWSSEQESKGRCTLCKKQVSEDGGMCSIWRPICPYGYVSIGDIAHVGIHAPNVAAVFHNVDRSFVLPVGYDLVWRNCLDDYTTPVSIWHPRAPEGYVSPGCVAVASFTEPEPDSVYCVAESLAEETVFEEQEVWSAPESYPWACHIYQVQSDALHFVALRQSNENSDWKPTRVVDDPKPRLQTSDTR